MSIIGIVGGQKQMNQLKKEIKEDIKGRKVEIISINPNSIENVKNIKFDITIVCGSIEVFKGKEKYIRDIFSNSKYLVLNADTNIENLMLKDINIKIITYGLNQKSTITVSSIKENEIIICIQRAFKNLEGNMVETKEVKRQLTKNNIKNIYNSLIKEAIINVYST